ncbi:DUF2608 domain-containing protein [Candidatus Odyssella thessalonicensis]|uniref:DUF2608 domain-containing protein n=1 Tax=Candidatus Odyssella thessalonicensis TaxID=84647 RepID=UPI000225A9FC|nr:DUF2608 domain-containing protein [Candidatus Odyssella thessalonicensis]
MYKTGLIIVLLIFSISQHLSYAGIRQAKNFKEIKSILNYAGQDTLVIFDVDDVLLMPSDQILQRPFKKQLEEIEASMEARVGKTEARKLYSIILSQRQVQPVDLQIVVTIKNLQQKGIKVLALTNAPVGSFGHIRSMENWRQEELRSIGYDFEASWPNLSFKAFSSADLRGGLKEKHIKSRLFATDNSPTFIKGILCTCHMSKRAALQAFLTYAKLKPKKIIYLDDKLKYIKQLQEFALKEGIEFIGIEYTAAYQKQQELNYKRAKKQFLILERDGRWISDKNIDKP